MSVCARTQVPHGAWLCHLHLENDITLWRLPLIETPDSLRFSSCVRVRVRGPPEYVYFKDGAAQVHDLVTCPFNGMVCVVQEVARAEMIMILVRFEFITSYSHDECQATPQHKFALHQCFMI